MTLNRYIIDASSLMQLNRINPIDIYPTPWKKIESLAQSGQLFSLREVFNEIVQGTDALADWTKGQRKWFKDFTPRQLEIAKSVLNIFPSFAKGVGKFDADVWIVAMAIEMQESLQNQQTISPTAIVVVTDEKIKGNSVKVPFVCKHFNIESCSLFEWFRKESWKF